MKKVNYFLAAIALILVSCEAQPEWKDEVENVVPGDVGNVSVKNTNGGAVIYFTCPAEKDVLGVKATYTLTNGEVMTRYASVGVDSVVLEGFGDTGQYSVNLQTLHKSGNLSNGHQASINPLTPYIFLIRETVNAEPAFGGVRYTWENPYEKDVRLSFYTYNTSQEQWDLYENFYSNGKIGKAIFRAFDPVETPFMLEVCDRWGNYAEPLEVSLTPIKEVKIVSMVGNTFVWSIYDFPNVTWRGDLYNQQHTARNFEKALDGKAPHNDANTLWNPGGDMATLANYITGNTSNMPFPLYITIDMGRKAMYTRMNILSRLRSPQFSAALPVHFDIWGSNAPKPLAEIGDKDQNLEYWTGWSVTNGADAWKEDGTWTHVSECRLVLSDGTSKFVDGMVLSEEDYLKYSSTGFDFDIDHLQAYRYLRLQIHETNTGQNILHIVGVRFWGQYDE